LSIGRADASKDDERSAGRECKLFHDQPPGGAAARSAGFGNVLSSHAAPSERSFSDMGEL
jgi:hypothetical protein